MLVAERFGLDLAVAPSTARPIAKASKRKPRAPKPALNWTPGKTFKHWPARSQQNPLPTLSPSSSKSTPGSFIIPFPSELRPKLPTIVGNVDYLTLRQQLEQIDALLLASGTEKEFVELALKDWLKPGRRVPSAREQEKFQLRDRRALRCNVLRTLLQEDYRGFSCQLAGNPLFQWWCTTTITFKDQRQLLTCVSRIFPLQPSA